MFIVEDIIYVITLSLNLELSQGLLNLYVGAIFLQICQHFTKESLLM